jgi:N-methylhydantoinase A
VTWRARVRCRLRAVGTGRLAASDESLAPLAKRRRAWFAGSGWLDVPIHFAGSLTPDVATRGPAIVESSFTTVVVDPGALASRTAGGGLLVRFAGRDGP